MIGTSIDSLVVGFVWMLYIIWYLSSYAGLTVVHT